MPQEKYILVVDDEPNIREFVKRSLEKHGFKVKLANNGWDALAEFEHTNFVLVILDIMMPQMNGLEVCRRIRQTSIVSIIVLTALGEESDKIAALNQGADDYLTKPFSIGELLARVQTVLRRTSWVDTPRSVGTQRFGNIEIDFEPPRQSLVFCKSWHCTPERYLHTRHCCGACGAQNTVVMLNICESILGDCDVK